MIRALQLVLFPFHQDSPQTWRRGQRWGQAWFLIGWKSMRERTLLSLISPRRHTQNTTIYPHALIRRICLLIERQVFQAYADIFVSLQACIYKFTLKYSLIQNRNSSKYIKTQTEHNYLPPCFNQKNMLGISKDSISGLCWYLCFPSGLHI